MDLPSSIPASHAADVMELVVASQLRSSHLLERSLEEVRRRTKVIGRFSGETRCLNLCWAVLDIFIAGARGLGLSDLDFREVVQLKTARAYPDKGATEVA